MKRSDLPFDTHLQAQRRYVADKDGVPVDVFGRFASDDLPDDFPVPYCVGNDPYGKVRWQQRVNAYNNKNGTAY